ncbi:MAG: nitrilase-related carbon-nitrogen hydrolase [Propionibacteriaceae bacterium]
MKVAAIQLTSDACVENNTALAVNKIREVAAAGAQLVVLPEATSTGFRGNLSDRAQTLQGSFATMIRDVARDCKICVVVGMITPGNYPKVRNTLLITNGDDLDTHYDKIHLYDALGVRESDTVEPGSELVIVTVAGVKIGFATCYDIRFPDLFTELGRQGAQIICVPASWADGPDKTAQFELLVRARAMDSQAFIIAADQAPPADAGRLPLGVGSSLVTAPTGIVLAKLGREPGVIVTEINLDEVAKVRAAVPILGQ